MGGDPLFPVSHGESVPSDHRTFEACVRLAAGGYRTAAPGEARSRARRVQGLAAFRKCQIVRRLDVGYRAGRPLSTPVDDGTAAARRDPRCDRRLADRIGRWHPSADGMGRPALGRSDDIGNIGHADRAGADGGAAGRCDLSAGIDAALAATLAHDADHAQPAGAAGGRDWSVIWPAAGRCPARWSIISSPRPSACRSTSRS